MVEIPKVIDKPYADTINFDPPPRRVAFIYDGTVYGGVEVYVLTLLQHLNTLRYIPVVVIPSYNYRFCPPKFLEQVEALGVPILTSLDPSKSRSLSFFKDVNNIRSLFKLAKIDVVHIQTSRFDGGRRATLAARLAGVSAILRTEHIAPSINSDVYSKYTVKAFDWLTRYIVTDSNSNRAEQIKLLRRDPNKVVASHCGIDLARFTPKSSTTEAKLRYGLDPNLPVVGAIGRLVEQKGHVYLLEAAAGIIKEFGPVNFLLVGDGPLEKQLKSQATQLNISQFIHFVGFQSQYLQYLEAMDITVMPSVHEGFSISLLEFMAMSKPTVVTDYPSFLEAVTDGENGIVVAVRNGDALAKGILTLLHNPDYAKQLGQAALIRVTQNFSIERLSNDMMALYDTVLAQAS